MPKSLAEVLLKSLILDRTVTFTLHLKLFVIKRSQLYGNSVPYVESPHDLNSRSMQFFS